MFTQTLISAAVLALASSASAKPVGSARLPRQDSISSSVSASSATSIASLSAPSFDGWGGFSCLDNFDSFYGSADNFYGSSNVQTVEQQEVVCQSVDITVIQQQLSIIQEFAKQIITQEVCEVEVQTIVWSQFVAGFSSFSDDFRHISGRDIGFDGSIASHIGSLVDSEGSINTNNFGFQGSDIGSHLIQVSGSNWVEGTSETTVSQAFQASQAAIVASTSGFSHSSFNSGFGGLGSGVVSVGAF